MFRNKSIKSVITAITFGAMVSAGTYFFMPPPSSSYACDANLIWQLHQSVREAVELAVPSDAVNMTDVLSAMRHCLGNTLIAIDEDGNGSLSTYS